MTLYLLDANTLIRAHEDYYPLDRIPAFWKWLLDKAGAGIIKMPREIYGEVDKSPDLLGQWMRRIDVRSALELREATDMQTVQDVTTQGYAPDLTDIEVIEVGQDPFLIAAALRDPRARVVVSKENSRPSKKRANRQVPDVCAQFDVLCINDFQLWRELDFRIP